VIWRDQGGCEGFDVGERMVFVYFLETFDDTKENK